MSSYPDWFIELIHALPNKRPRVMAEHILEHGQITTEELKTIYGYNHPPRAARDLREAGIPLETFSVKDAEGRSIAAYRFGDLNQVRRERLAGRQVFPKAFKLLLLERQQSRCAICNDHFEDRYLQIDHRVPYEVRGDSPIEARNPDDYLLVCGTCNRAKSWSCEHCANWSGMKDAAICQTCYWATPTDYQHIAQQSIRRVDLAWNEEEVAVHDALRTEALLANESLPEFIKTILKRHLQR
jgi:hypothetical protein